MTNFGRTVSMSGRGIYYAWEGSDGAGKTTQINRFCEMLKNNGRNMLVIDMPSHELPVGKFLREEVLSGKTKLDSDLTQCMMVLDIADAGRSIISPMLAAGRDVVTSRGNGSNLAYSVALGLQEEAMLSLHRQFGLLRPDLTFFLRTSPQTAMDRIEGRGEEKTLYEKEEMQRRVLAAFDRLARRYEDDWLVIDGEKKPDEIASDVVAKWKSFMAQNDLLDVVGAVKA